ncbi:MAG TPA: hypothetical protein VHW09_18875 [Bryobacteraceae bacterium]|jgi:hypothetical protein|nr:hypothetical protein [Bryobacteraceae bacterium]
MNCHEFWDRFPRRGHDISREQQAHLAECATCAAQWAPHRALAAGLDSLREEWRGVEAPPRVEAGLLAAFRAQSGYQARRSPGPSKWKPALAWAMAAAATIVFALVLIDGHPPAPARPGTVATPRFTVQPPVEVAAGQEADPDDESAVLGEGFVRLPNAPGIGPNDDYNVVRMELPGSAMIDAGISLSDDRAAGTVLADVALGADGMPRAVRLVTDSGTN